MLLGKNFDTKQYKNLINSSFVDYNEATVKKPSNVLNYIKSILLARKNYKCSESEIRLQYPEIAKAQEAARLDGGLSAPYQWVRLNELRKFVEARRIESVCEFGSGGSTALWNALISGKICSLEESDKWLERTKSILPSSHNVELIHARRKVIEFDGEPSTCYDLSEEFFSQNFDLVYIDGPTAKPMNADESALRILDDHHKRKMPNIDVEKFIKNGTPPKYILVDGRRPTVRRLCQNYADIYNIYLWYHPNNRWITSGRHLYHTIFVRKG